SGETMYTSTMLLDVTETIIEPDLNYPSLNIRTQARIVLGSFALSTVLWILWVIDGFWLSRDASDHILAYLNRCTYALVVGYLCGPGIVFWSSVIANKTVRFYQRHPRWLPSFMVAEDDVDEEANRSHDSEKDALMETEE
ncbi:MAG: hypothetical protein Q9184_007485, partial [Pyrenodesmia sp. 2 TL-2023]